MVIRQPVRSTHPGLAMPEHMENFSGATRTISESRLFRALRRMRLRQDNATSAKQLSEFFRHTIL
ncbi:hypothetical protein CQJ32_08235 [Adlercreutzia equolifaciens subsp. celatus]|nr:hypothetical protein CQJ32_08235 [Adlercreutzia equolifaciens subsp. celatus]